MYIPQADDQQSTLTARVVQQILHSAEQGAYRASERLPSERELAGLLTVSRNTVTAAYAELEQRGVLRRIQGKGAFLCAVPTPEETFSWSGKISRNANSLDEPVLELLARRCAGDIPFPLSAGTPSLQVFPNAEFQASVQRVLTQHIPQALAVAPTEGQWALRTAIGSWLGVTPTNVMITAGAQEGIDLLARCLIEPGDYVVIDSPTYPGALQSFLSMGARLLPWSTDWSLPQLEKLLLRYRPKLIFTSPTFQNPTGRVMTTRTRLGLLALAKRYRVPIVEDDVYGRTVFPEQRPVPESLYKQDEHSLVIGVSTFSKMLAPGLRIGWLTAPIYMVKQLSLIKMRSNLFTGGLGQLVLADMLQCGSFERHLSTLRAHHASLCRVAVSALQPSVRRGFLRFHVPAGGLYLWCKLMLPVHSEQLLTAWEAEGVSVAPGSAFEPRRKQQASEYFRICFSAVSEEKLVRGVEILNRVLEEMSPSRL